MTFCGEASTWAKLSLILIIIALGLQCGGYGSNYWMARKTARDKYNYGIGLWKMTNCSGSYNSSCTQTNIPDTYKTIYMKVVQGLESCALILIFVATVCMVFYVGYQRSRTRGMAKSVMSIIFFAASFSFSGMVRWIVTVPAEHHPGWSMGLTVFAWILCIAAGLLLIPDLREYDYKDISKCLIETIIALLCYCNVRGEFQNLPVTREDHPPPPQERMYEGDVQPAVEPQGPLAAPVYQYLNYDKGKKRDGF